MPAYEAGDFQPPAPIARAVVRGPSNAACGDVPLLVDTGADVSVIPLSVAEAVGAQVQPCDVRIRVYDGDEVTCSQAELRIELFQYCFRGRFLVGEAEYGILGRNILNLLVVTLDGPRLSWSV